MAGLATTAGNILAPPLLTRLKLKPPSTPLLSLSSFQSNLFGLRLCISTFHFQSFPLSLSSSHQVSVSARYSGKNNDDDQALDISTVRSDKVRLIDEQQNMIGVVSKGEAIRRAEDSQLDLVVLSPDADPPVVRIMNYDKYRYEQQKKKREQQKKSAASRMDLKELKMGYNIDVHDYSVRLRAAQKFLKDGDKVKVMVTMKGREKAFIDKAIQLIRKFQSDLGELATEEHNNFARRKKEDFTERFIFLILVPNKNVVQKAPEGPKKKRDSAPNEVSAAPNEVSAAPNEVSVASNEVSAGV
ncbi:translation initiation factor IF3-4, chloroplastic-like isoform X1 [Chenopodium quinoa]|uniref:translation initiation factor IF3-4, chloroplastic-like isoform X1 n=1 Tax=Chenopodium quinoa TaxID=63459 RepID=UPI000B780EA8|nr:translation initiation factor IF3-4, chloroplastic-like isoform X1 [Chenopodium quinoa]